MKIGLDGLAPIMPPTSRRRDLFVHGPLRWLDICLVFKRSPAALSVWLLINLQWRMREGQPWIRLPPSRISELGLTRWSVRRALAVLRHEGLIRVAPFRRGHPTMVALVREEREPYAQ